MATVAPEGYAPIERTRSAELREQHTSHWHVPDSEHLGDMSDKAVRANFLKKVYGILAAQMTLTVMIAATMMASAPVRNVCMVAAMSHPILMNLGMFVPMIASLVCLMASKNKYPQNYYLLFIFTVSMSVMVGWICAVYQAAGLGGLVLEAFAITMLIFISLSGYAIYSGQDFSWMGAGLLAALMCMIGVSFIGFFIPGLVNNVIYSGLGALLFCGYILSDTYRICQVFGPDDYIVAAIEVYLDIINLFLYILQLLAESQN